MFVVYFLAFSVKSVTMSLVDLIVSSFDPPPPNRLVRWVVRPLWSGAKVLATHTAALSASALSHGHELVKAHPQASAAALGAGVLVPLIAVKTRQYYQSWRSRRALSAAIVEESFRAGSDYYTVNIPDYSFRVYRRGTSTAPSGNEVLSPVGMGFRFDRWLVMPQHILQQHPAETLVLTDKNGASYPAPEEWTETGVDCVFTERPNSVLPNLKGAGIGVLTHPVAVTTVSVHLSDNASSGMLKHSKTFGYVVYEGSTRTGFSGAPYAVGSRVYGMHTCGGGANFGLAMEYIKILIQQNAQVQPESSEGEALRRMLRAHGATYEDLEFGATAHGRRQVRFRDRYYDLDLAEAEDLNQQYGDEYYAEDPDQAQFEERVAREPINRAQRMRRRFNNSRRERTRGECIAYGPEMTGSVEFQGNEVRGSKPPPMPKMSEFPALPMKSGPQSSASGTKQVTNTNRTPSPRQNGSPTASSLIFGDKDLSTLVEHYTRLNSALPSTVSGVSNRAAASPPPQKRKETLRGPATSTPTLSDVMSSLLRIEELLKKLSMQNSSPSTSRGQRGSARSATIPPSVTPSVGKGKPKPSATKPTTAYSATSSTSGSQPSSETQKRRARRRRRRATRTRKNEPAPGSGDPIPSSSSRKENPTAKTKPVKAGGA